MIYSVNSDPFRSLQDILKLTWDQCIYCVMEPPGSEMKNKERRSGSKMWPLAAPVLVPQSWVHGLDGLLSTPTPSYYIVCNVCTCFSQQYDCRSQSCLIFSSCAAVFLCKCRYEIRFTNTKSWTLNPSVALLLSLSTPSSSLWLSVGFNKGHKSLNAPLRRLQGMCE